MNRMELDRFVFDFGFDNDEDEENLTFEQEVQKTLILARGGEKNGKRKNPCN